MFRFLIWREGNSFQRSETLLLFPQASTIVQNKFIIPPLVAEVLTVESFTVVFNQILSNIRSLKQGDGDQNQALFLARTVLIYRMAYRFQGRVNLYDNAVMESFSTARR